MKKNLQKLKNKISYFNKTMKNFSFRLKNTNNFKKKIIRKNLNL